MMDLAREILADAGLAPVQFDPESNHTGAEKGAYALAFQLATAIQLNIPKVTATEIPAGCYIYVGSAYGPGGMGSRLKRHFSKDKKCHWHVDRLTLKATHVSALMVAGGRECELGQTLSKSDRFQHILSGFGSSDCRMCKSHLLSRV